MKADLSIKILCPLTRYIAEQHGKQALQDIATRTGLKIEDIEEGRRWASTRRIEQFCSLVDELIGGDETTYLEACKHSLKDAYGPLRFLLWAASPGFIYQQAMKNLHVVSATGRYQTLDEGRNHFHVRYTSAFPESRHLCLLRQANIMQTPTFWGLPEALVEDRRCIGHGDDCCEYHVRWSSHLRLTPLVAGAALGAVLALALTTLAIDRQALWVLLPILGATVATLVEWRRIHRSNRHVGQESLQALQQLAEQETKTREEIAALNQRQNEWVKILEEQVAERTGALQKVVDGMGVYQENKVATLRGVSHDLRSPLPSSTRCRTTCRAIPRSTRTGVPMLVLTGQAASTSQGRGAAQEAGREDIDVVEMFRPVTKYSAMVTNAFESAQQTHPLLQRLPHDRIQYVGQPPRVSPRAKNRDRD